MQRKFVFQTSPETNLYKILGQPKDNFISFSVCCLLSLKGGEGGVPENWACYVLCDGSKQQFFSKICAFVSGVKSMKHYEQSWDCTNSYAVRGVPVGPAVTERVNMVIRRTCHSFCGLRVRCDKQSVTRTRTGWSQWSSRCWWRSSLRSDDYTVSPAGTRRHSWPQHLITSTVTELPAYSRLTAHASPSPDTRPGVWVWTFTTAALTGQITHSPAVRRPRDLSSTAS